MLWNCLCLLPSDNFFNIFFKKNCFWSVIKFGSRSGPEVKKIVSYSTQLSTKFILLINVKMPTSVGILTFMSMINTTSERHKTRNFFICRGFSFFEQLNFHAQLSWAWKKFYKLGAWPNKMSGLILIQNVCKNYQMTLAGNELKPFLTGIP